MLYTPIDVGKSNMLKEVGILWRSLVKPMLLAMVLAFIIFYLLSWLLGGVLPEALQASEFSKIILNLLKQIVPPLPK